MLTKIDRASAGIWPGLLLLAVGVAIGLALEPERWFRSVVTESGGGDVALHRYLRQPDGPVDVAAVAPDNGLDTIHVVLDSAAAKTLQTVRQRALERGMIVQTDDDTVDAKIEVDGQSYPVELRIKGDWLDHVAGDKWSYRIRLSEGKVFGMRVFSVQAPMTRGRMWEWLVLEAARREGVLAPRANFVNLVVNGHNAGVHYLEEHFSKELLEAQGRREGPIVLWDESTHWDTLLHVHDVFTKQVELPVPGSVKDGTELPAAFVRAYGEKRLGSSDSLNRSFFSAVEQMRALQAQVIAADDEQSRMRRMQALTDLQGATVDDLVDVERLACAHALASVFQIEHALFWHNMRFYHDPVSDRLEPIMFDNMAQIPAEREPVPHRTGGIIEQFVVSDAYYNGIYRWLGQFCRPGYLDELFGALRPDLERFEAALLADEGLPAQYRVDSMLQRLRTQVGFLRTLLYPADPLNTTAYYELDSSSTTLLRGQLEVVAWGTTRTPVVVEGFRFSNGVFIAAAEYLAPDSLGTSLDGDGAVVLPRDGRAASFRFGLDQRLANLENVDQVIAAALERTAGGGQLDLDIELVFRPLAAMEAESEPITFRRREPTWRGEGGRPVAPTLDEALARHPFLEWDPLEQRLAVRTGTWQVSGDLVLPSQTPLFAGPGVTLQFEPDAVLLSDGALLFQGAPNFPIVLEPIEGAEAWKGIAVIHSSGRSHWRNVTVRKTDAIERAGWVTTGGITFYHSPVTMELTRIEGTVAEDGTNIFGTDFILDQVTFVACVSDSFDGDFVTGTVRACTFRDGLADGVDFSGSDVDIVDCRFLNMGDKAISAGERSVVRVRGGIADGVSIGIACKDDSDVDARDMTIRGARAYAVAAFVKKPEFGPSRMVASGLQIENSGLGDTIVQTGCSVELDGVVLPTVDLDVAKLYEEKILGQ